MTGDTRYSIGELARRAGLTVKTVRFYADRGIVPPTGRTPAGHRWYGAEAVARLELVRTLRELGLGLPTIRQVVDRELSLGDVAAAHAEALDVQIRTLRLRRAVLTAVARRGATPEEMDLMHRLATLSEAERRRLVGEFLDAVFGDVGPAPEFAGVMRSLTPELPEEPNTEQVEAWVELAELVQDREFQAAVRELARHHAADRGPAAPRRDPVALVRDRVGPALGLDPASAQADSVVAAVTAQYAELRGRPDDAELRRQLLARLEAANDPRRERYLRLLAVINGWTPPESSAPALTWFTRALAVRIPA
ncbi:MerR family transcriptional regulator [Kitasatospora sp. NPDC051984]|uniref:MerR family transcriptional regulator n=1 Tax=Kitasatospora sp. NPDC051984 TaxID=3364059 RepID=UPI0037C88F6B